MTSQWEYFTCLFHRVANCSIVASGITLTYIAGSDQMITWFKSNRCTCSVIRLKYNLESSRTVPHRVHVSNVEMMSSFRFMICLVLLPVQTVVSEVIYVCFSGSEDTINIRCPEGQKIKVEEALYGQNPWDACYYLNGDGHCNQRTETSLECCNKNSCQSKAKRVYLPCGKYSTFLRIVYECVKGENITCGPHSSSPKTSGHTPVRYRSKGQGMKTGQHQIIETVPVDRGAAAVDLMQHTHKNNDSTYRQVFHPVSAEETTNNSEQSDYIVVWACLATGLVVILCLALAILLLWQRRFSSGGKCQRSPENPERRPDVTETRLNETEVRKSPEGQSINGGQTAGGIPGPTSPSADIDETKCNSDTHGFLNRAFQLDSAAEHVAEARGSSPQEPSIGEGRGLLFSSPDSEYSACSSSEDERSVTDSGVDVICETHNSKPSYKIQGTPNQVADMLAHKQLKDKESRCAKENVTIDAPLKSSSRVQNTHCIVSSCSS